MQTWRSGSMLTAGALAALLCFKNVAPAASPGGRNLVPANFNARADAEGLNYDVDQRGMINDGSNDCFDGGVMLNVNGHEFMGQQALMTADGRELVLSATLGGLEVTRRVKIDGTVGGARYVESIKNPTNSQVSVTVFVHSQFGGQCQTVVTDSGSPNAGVLGKNDGGIVAVQHPNSRPSVMFLVADPKSKFKPTLAINQNYTFTFTWTLNVAAGRTVSLMHTVRQTQLPGVPAAQALAALIKPHRSRQWLSDLPSQVRRTIVNFGRGGGFQGGDSPELLAHLERLGVSRGAADVLAIGEDTRLQGTASGAELSIETPYGAAKIPFESVAALVGGKHLGSSTEVYLRDGQVLRGKVAAHKLRFTMTSGLSIDLKIATLDRLVTRIDPQDGKPARDVYAMCETFDGERLALVRSGSEDDASPAPGARLSLQTAWGPREVPLADLLWLRLPDDQPGHLAALADGSRFFAFLPDAELVLTTALFGPLEFPPSQLSSIVALQDKDDGEQADDDNTQPNVVLAGGNVLAGVIDVPELRFMTEGGIVPVPPEQIRTLHNVSSDGEQTPFGGTVFYAEVWGGGTVRGELQETLLPIRLADTVCQVPVRDLIDASVPAPRISEEMKDQIAALIRDLGHAEWDSRESASRELAELGFLAKAQLVEAGKHAGDPEVNRRLKALIDNLKD